MCFFILTIWYFLGSLKPIIYKFLCFSLELGIITLRSGFCTFESLMNLFLINSIHIYSTITLVSKSKSL